jgi:hypothetical protein
MCACVRAVIVQPTSIHINGRQGSVHGPLARKRVCCCAGFLTVQPTQGGKRGSAQQEPSLSHTHPAADCKMETKMFCGAQPQCAQPGAADSRGTKCETPQVRPHTQTTPQHTQTTQQAHTLRCLETTQQSIRLRPRTCPSPNGDETPRSPHQWTAAHPSNHTQRNMHTNKGSLRRKSAPSGPTDTARRLQAAGRKHTTKRERGTHRIVPADKISTATPCKTDTPSSTQAGAG